MVTAYELLKFIEKVASSGTVPQDLEDGAILLLFRAGWPNVKEKYEKSIDSWDTGTKPPIII